MRVFRENELETIQYVKIKRTFILNTSKQLTDEHKKRIGVDITGGGALKYTVVMQANYTAWRGASGCS